MHVNVLGQGHIHFTLTKLINSLKHSAVWKRYRIQTSCNLFTYNWFIILTSSLLTLVCSVVIFKNIQCDPIEKRKVFWHIVFEPSRLLYDSVVSRQILIQSPIDGKNISKQFCFEKTDYNLLEKCSSNVCQSPFNTLSFGHQVSSEI